MKIHTCLQALHCICEVMKFAIYLNPSRLLGLLYTVKDCIQRDMNTTKCKCKKCSIKLAPTFVAYGGFYIQGDYKRND
jgi:hypothetical protein